MRVEELEANGFTLLEELEHDRIMPFIREQLKRSTPAKWALALATFLPLGFAVGSAWAYHEQGRLQAGDALGRFSIGIALVFALIPVHEHIHVLAYRSQGATSTSYAVDLRRFVFMALADRFVADRKAFRIIALAPFVIISSVLVGLMPFADPPALFVLLGALFMHTGACSGDIGLLAYLYLHRDKDVVTYDDVPAKRSYFFGRDKA